ncbi:MAG: hypothetical protein CVU39_21035 [Chloroflexi bacterium HGW-Chloroflexi-10]|jgi:uncharacterized membrane protein|nr:MAG: hypothetical protein CVU39_21035 [Chloroflexi bacterium HGW-Chloroflexi-10]
MQKLKFLLASRKFWAALVGLVFVVLQAWNPDFPLEAEQVSNLIYVLVAYILGVALEDGARSVQNRKD